jgi:hypothetical protein
MKAETAVGEHARHGRGWTRLASSFFDVLTVSGLSHVLTT